VERNLRSAAVFNSGAGSTCQGSENAWRNGNRILVSKFAYEFREPQRWDVFVFRPPGDASKNYIKRLVGLPDETLRLYRGDAYRGDYHPEAWFNQSAVKYKILRKPADKVLSMKQLVYDNDYLTDDMAKKGWPTRWTAWPRRAPAGDRPAGSWQSTDGTLTFSTNGSAADPVWIRYQHFMPTFTDWEALLASNTLVEEFRRQIRPQLITDMYGYNSSVGWVVDRPVPLEYSDSMFLGLNWVRDLVLECELTVENPQGTALLELVAGGVPFRCAIDLATGQATLSIETAGPQIVFEGSQGQKTLSSQTRMRTAGTYRLRLANVDQQLHLWVNEQLIAFPMPAAYGPLDPAHGPLGNVTPQTDAQDGLDLAPAAVGSAGAALRVSHMRLYRDVYYIAKSSPHGPPTDILDKNLSEAFKMALPDNSEEINADFQGARARLFSTPSLWPKLFAQVADVAFPLAKKPNPSEDQFLALGDNSPQSQDSRLWGFTHGMRQDTIRGPGQPDREFYVERNLLIGKALLIYWPIGQWGFVR